MVATQLPDPGDAQQGHGGGHLRAEDVGRPSHPALACGHEAVEVRTADQPGASPEGDGGDEVAAGRDAAVDVDLRPVADGVDDVRQRLERHGGPVELATAVVRHHHRV